MTERTEAIVRELAKKASALSPLGEVANYADLPAEARAILQEFADQPMADGVISMGTTMSTKSAIAVRKLLCGQHVVGFAAWIEA